ncbi:MAG TPA: hypothetical protein VK790_03540 [Solirubrobacteraceae bacterium]|jgi:hypothetical protein|nr:hypothetical protein [Solirubrobacteraceae bacterium]
MRRSLRTLSATLVCAVVVLGIVATPTMAYTHEQAWKDAKEYALHHFSGGPFEDECEPSGKNKQGEAQWYCYGSFLEKGGQWHVNVGPYGEITYARE